MIIIQIHWLSLHHSGLHQNKTFSIDISNCSKEISKNESNNLIRIFAAIEPVELTLPDNYDKLKKQFVSGIPSLKKLNGNQLDEYVRYNDVINNFNQKGETVENLADNAASVALKADLVDKVTANAGDLGDNISKAKKYALMFGTILSKWEIIITFQKILTQIILFVDHIKWPKIYIDLSLLDFYNRFIIP